MSDPTWTVDTPDDGDITGLYLYDELYTPVPGSTINPTFEFPSKTAFDNFRKYVEAAKEQTVSSGTSYNGIPYYREDLTSYSNVSALSFGLVPTVSNNADVWAVLTGGTDGSNVTRSDNVWELEFVVIADHDAYTDRTDLENNRKSQVL